MNKNIQTGLIITLFIIAFSGSTYSSENKHQHSHSAHATQITNGLILNNGDKWMMDAHTRKISSEMEKTFYDADHSTKTSLNTMGAQLESQLGVLIKGCTMSGEAHNQLHVFLSDYTLAVKNLANAKDYETARNSAIKIKGELETYKKHFK
ncbi:hypothetical protein KAR91_04335 [Candidatus Pacearchaeota archaeon]|nr:hypothetical protein [Candidatus Pacearchaeota archaeon]